MTPRFEYKRVHIDRSRDQGGVDELNEEAVKGWRVSAYLGHGYQKWIDIYLLERAYNTHA
jgi:hypothetical protein